MFSLMQILVPALVHTGKSFLIMQRPPEEVREVVIGMNEENI